MATEYDERCEVCRILRDPQADKIIFESSWWRVTLNPDQFYLGRAWVTLLEHRRSLAVLTPQQWDDLHDVIKRYEEACLQAFGASLLNWVFLMNNAFQDTFAPVPHAHAHVRPRYLRTPTVGLWAFGDTRFGYHYDPFEKRVVDGDMLQEIQRRLVAALPPS
jgi:diadenosine tetraphosphate (Ap4A) HIT family hydrolase